MFSQLTTVKLDDEKAHSRLVMALQISRATERYLRNCINDGAIAAQEIKLRGKRID